VLSFQYLSGRPKEKIMQVHRLTTIGMLAMALFAAAGCASMFMKGGALAPAGYQPQKVVVAYTADGAVPANVNYQLVLTEKGEAMFERSPDGSGALFETRWTDEKGDHFAGWVATSHAYEFVVPKDRAKPAKRYVYPKGSYTVQSVGGQERPTPTMAMDPVATLTPR